MSNTARQILDKATRLRDTASKAGDVRNAITGRWRDSRMPPLCLYRAEAVIVTSTFPVVKLELSEEVLETIRDAMTDMIEQLHAEAVTLESMVHVDGVGLELDLDLPVNPEDNDE